MDETSPHALRMLVIASVLHHPNALDVAHTANALMRGFIASSPPSEQAALQVAWNRLMDELDLYQAGGKAN
jgi:hypothetical protein